jgi:long-chain acyl-CoA synthetase
VDARTIPQLVIQRAAEMPASPAHFRRTGDEWVATTWADYAAQVRRGARAFIELGLQPGDTVAMLGPNTQEWVVFDVAAMASGAVPAGIYPTSSPDEIAYIAEHANIRALLVQHAELLERAAMARERLPELKVVVVDTEAGQPEGSMSWQQFMELGDERHDAELDQRMEAAQPEDLATLIYTSGTTGLPKGVMLSNDNLVFTASQAGPTFQVGPIDRTLSYLPLSHIAEQMFTIHVPASTGQSVYFSRGIDHLASDLQQVRPTLFFGVPRVWEKFQAAIQGNVASSSGVQRRIFNWSIGVGQRATRAEVDGSGLGFGSRAKHKVAKALVHNKLRSALGLDAARLFLSGAAPLAKDTLEFFAGLGIPIRDIYGQSEDTGPTTANTLEHYRPGTAGRPFPGIEVKLDEDGEILVRGRNVFMGYYKDPEATAETLRNGWLHSGDLGEFDNDGFLTVTGRKKDIIITAGGKNIAPRLIEDGIKAHELVAECVLIGDLRNYLTALVTLDEEASAAFMKQRGLSGEPHENEEIRAAIQKAVDETNAHFARVEQVKKFAILPEQLTVEGGELTPTLKVRRNVVAERYSEVIESLYADEAVPAQA